MTGRQIMDSLTGQEFYSKALHFEMQKSLELETADEAKEFLILFCVLQTTKEYAEYSEEKLLKAYKKISAILANNSKISSKEFLENPEKDMTYSLRGTMCFMVEKITC